MAFAWIEVKRAHHRCQRAHKLFVPEAESVRIASIGSLTRAEVTGASSDAPAIGSSALVFGAVVRVPPILLGA